MDFIIQRPLKCNANLCRLFLNRTGLGTCKGDSTTVRVCGTNDVLRAFIYTGMCRVDVLRMKCYCAWVTNDVLRA